MNGVERTFKDVEEKDTFRFLQEIQLSSIREVTLSGKLEKQASEHVLNVGVTHAIPRSFLLMRPGKQ